MKKCQKTFGRTVNVVLTAPEEFYLPSTKRNLTHTLRKRSAVQTLLKYSLCQIGLTLFRNQRLHSTHHEIVKRMKASGSPCPPDQISIISFKIYPFLRSYLRAICEEIWATEEIPSIWCKATTILIYKKGDTNDPSSFRPTTYEPVALRVLTSLIRDRIYSFVASINCIENEIRKGFAPGMSGTYEHIANHSYLINHARKKQKKCDNYLN